MFRHHVIVGLYITRCCLFRRQLLAVTRYLTSSRVRAYNPLQFRRQLRRYILVGRHAVAFSLVVRVRRYKFVGDVTPRFSRRPIRRHLFIGWYIRTNSSGVSVRR